MDIIRLGNSVYLSNRYNKTTYKKVSDADTIKLSPNGQSCTFSILDKSEQENHNIVDVDCTIEDLKKLNLRA